MLESGLQNKTQGVIPASSIILVLFALGGALLYEKPFESARPSNSKDITAEHDNRKVKQWQDPFYHKLEHIVGNASNEGEHKAKPQNLNESLRSFVSEFEAARITTPKAKTLVLLNLVDSSSETSIVEFRRRQRVALSHALTANDYRPASPGNINYLFAPKESSLELSRFDDARTLRSKSAIIETHKGQGSVANGELIPFEFYSNHKAEQGYANVIVLWAPDQSLKQPAVYLQYLLSHLAHSLNTVTLIDQVDTAILGPSYSHILKSMLEADKAVLAKIDAFASNNIRVKPTSLDWYMPGLQVSASSADQPNSVSELSDWPKYLLSDQLVVSHATTVGQHELINSSSSQSKDMTSLNKLIEIQKDDFHTSRELIAEFKARAIKLCKPNTNILLILEADYLYGLKYEDSFKRLIDEECGKSDKANVSVAHYFSYIDGEASNSHRNSPDRNKKYDVLNRALSGDFTVLDIPENRKIEMPTGPHQLDYIRRLAKSIADDDVQVDAIGVVGVDVYDKQLIFQAVRSYLHKPLLFTTDLNAIYGLPEFFAFNQNLLIASAFGLSSKKMGHSNLITSNSSNWMGHNAIQFRDSYQTAYYEAASIVLGPKGVNLVTKPFNGSNANHDYKPKLYEVGRNGIVDISATRIFEFTTVYVLSLTFILLPLILFTTYILKQIIKTPSSSRLIGHKAERQCLKRLFWFNLLVLVSLSIYFTFVHFNLPNAEPFLILEGVSGIPTYVFRFSAFVIGFSALVYGVQLSLSNNAKLKHYFRLEVSGAEHSCTCRASKLSLARVWLKCSLKETFALTTWQENLHKLPTRSARRTGFKHRPNKTADQVFSEYRQLDATRARLTRVIPRFLIISVIIHFVVSTHFGEPYLMGQIGFASGGEFVRYAMVLSMYASLFVVMYCCDVMRLCALFVNYQRHDYLKWGEFPKRSIYRHLSDYAKCRLTSLEIVVRRTEMMSLFIALPFIVIFLTMVSKSNLFDGWNWHGGILSFYALMIGYAFYCSSMLQSATANIRRKVLGDLQKEQTLVKTGESEVGDETSLEQAKSSIEDAIIYVSEIKRGLYSPLIRHPLFQAIAWPSSAVSILTLTQMLW